MTQLERAIFDAALALTDVKREAQQVFRTGIAGISSLVASSTPAKRMAERTMAAGRRLDEAVDAYRRAS